MEKCWLHAKLNLHQGCSSDSERCVGGDEYVPGLHFGPLIGQSGSSPFIGHFTLHISEPYLLVMEYVMYGKLLTHLREHRMKQSSFFNFSGNKDGAEVGEALTSKDLTKFAYGVAKGMEYLVSKGVSLMLE